MSVTEPVFHASNPLPVNNAALELPLLSYVTPASFRSFENANFMLFTPLVSQSPMSPHLVVAVVVSWTQSHDACLNVVSVRAANVHASAAQSVSYVVAVKTVLLAQASAILRLLQEVRAAAPEKVKLMSVTLAMFHVSSPYSSNLEASLNVSFRLMT